MYRLKVGFMVFVFLVFTSIANANIILNGDFENNSAGGVTQFNMNNAQFNSYVNNATAFGTSEEIDLVTGNDFHIPPQSGNWKLGLHNLTVQNYYDGFSLNLSSPIVAGMSYDLQFFAAGIPQGSNGPVQIGLSNSATDFGDLIFSGTPTSTTAWTQFDYLFTATSGKSFLTVRTDPNVFSNYAFVDNFTLTSVPEPSTLLLLGFGLAGAGLFRRKYTK